MNSVNKALPVFLIICACALAQAAGDERELDSFDAIDVASGIDLYLKLGERVEVDVDATTGAPDEIITEVDNGTLRIRRERGWFSNGVWGWFSSYRVNVTLPVLSSLTASGGSDARGEGTFTGARLELHASGGSDLALTVDVDELDITASGGSDVRLFGFAKRLTAKTSGGSDLYASRLTAKEADLTTSGGSDTGITVSDKLIAKASGGSDIRYFGNPQDKDIDASSGSDVRAARRRPAGR